MRPPPPGRRKRLFERATPFDEKNRIGPQAPGFACCSSRDRTGHGDDPTGSDGAAVGDLLRGGQGLMEFAKDSGWPRMERRGGFLAGE